MAKPWITSGIRVSLRIKNNFYERYITTSTCTSHCTICQNLNCTDIIKSMD